MLVPLLIVPVVSTLCGGLLALRFRRSLHMLLALSAGLLLGAAFLDLLPEALSLGAPDTPSFSRTLLYALLSFILFFAIENGLDHLRAGHTPQLRPRAAGRLAGILLIFHSLRDGMAIGAAYSASHAAGYTVALGIAAHDIGDGVNSVILTTRGEKAGIIDYLFLTADAIAPFAGGMLAATWFTSAGSSVFLLAVAAGFFIQMGASDFLPELRRSTKPKAPLFACVAGGIGLIYAANALLSPK